MVHRQSIVVATAARTRGTILTRIESTQSLISSSLERTRATSRARKATLLLFFVAVLIAVGAAAVRGQSAFDGCSPDTMTFNFSGATVSFTVPTCATTIHIDASGAQGGIGGNSAVPFAASVAGKGARMT